MRSNKELLARIKALQLENKELKEKNKKYAQYARKVTKDEIKQTNRTIKEVKARKKVEVENTGIFRYSIAYYNSMYDKTFRAWIITAQKQDERSMERQLKNYLMTEVGKTNNGLVTMFNRSTTTGFEAEEIGTNDIKGESLNRFRHEFR